MSKPQDFRDLLNLLESVEVAVGESGRKSQQANRDALRRRDSVIRNAPIPGADHPSVGDENADDPDWGEEAVHGGLPTDRFFFDPQNPDPKRRMPFLRSYDFKTDTTTLTPDNGAKTIGAMNAAKLKRYFDAQGKQAGKDYKIDDVYGVVKVAGKVK